MKRPATNRRISLLAAAFLILLAAALARAVWLQVIKGPEYAAMALRQQFAGRVEMLLGKRLNLEARHRRRTIPLAL